MPTTQHISVKIRIISTIKIDSEVIRQLRLIIYDLACKEPFYLQARTIELFLINNYDMNCNIASILYVEISCVTNFLFSEHFFFMYGGGGNRREMSSYMAELFY